MFGSSFLNAIPPQRREEFLTHVERAGAASLVKDGTCYADYRRLRINARRPA